MNEIMEQYGISLLESIGAIFAFAIIFECFLEGGLLSNIFADYFITICGLE